MSTAHTTGLSAHELRRVSSREADRRMLDQDRADRERLRVYQSARELRELSALAQRLNEYEAQEAARWAS